VLLALWSIVARFVDTREITGMNAWDKPLKFALSTIIYSVTWSWLIGQLQRGRRIASIAGSVIAVSLLIELVIITGAAAAGTTSHFNVATALSTTLWVIMGVSIAVLWTATFVAATLLFFSRFGDTARGVAVRSGAVIGLIGLALGFLMTIPTEAQDVGDGGIAGAHTVGMADGGPGLPILGWSTVAGDLRIPHFVGMHALQAIPIVLIAIELLSRRIVVLRDVGVRTALVGVAAIGYLAFVGLVAWQALRGQSIVQPDAATLVAGVAIVVFCVLGSGLIIARAALRRPALVATATPLQLPPTR